MIRNVLSISCWVGGYIPGAKLQLLDFHCTLIYLSELLQKCRMPSWLTQCMMTSSPLSSSKRLARFLVSLNRAFFWLPGAAVAKYVQFSLFAVVLVCKVYKDWISKYWAIVPIGKIRSGSWEPLATTIFICITHKYIILFCVCICLKTHFSICIVDSLTLSSRPTAL